MRISTLLVIGLGVAVAMLSDGPALADSPKLGEKFRAAAARVAKEADAIENLADRATALGDTGNARALAGDKKVALDDLHKAAPMARTIEDARERSQTLGVIGLGLARAGDRAGAREAFRESLQANDAVESLARAQDLAEIALMQARGGDLPAARETFAEAARVAVTIKSNDERKVGISLGYHRAHVVERQAQAGFVAEALESAEDFKLIDDDETYAEILIALRESIKTVPAADGRRIVDWVRRRAEAMKDDAGGAGTNTNKLVILGWVVKWSAYLGDIDEASALARSAGGKDGPAYYRDTMLLDIAEGRIEAGDKEAARDILREAFAGLIEHSELLASQTKCRWFLEIAKAQARIGDTDGVTRAVAAIAAEGDAEPEPPPGKEQDEDALEARRLEAKRHHVSGLAVLSSTRAARGDAEGARQCLREATELAKSVPEDMTALGSVPWKEIAVAHAMAGDLASALKTADTFADAVAEGFKALPDPPARPHIEQQVKKCRAEVLGDVIDDLLAAGDRATALRLIEADPSKDLVAMKLGDVINAHSRTGEIDAALGLLDRLSDPIYRASALFRIAEDMTDRAAKEKSP